MGTRCSSGELMGNPAATSEEDYLASRFESDRAVEAINEHSEVDLVGHVSRNNW